ncbi:MAG: hypothetical protein HYR85_19045 [Planctomycetes bacterium]|nr:hypothetical protein [Planctomycetota bacterium]MBI3847313.1 hypothetical protein [Planctomycetota bacterium]
MTSRSVGRSIFLSVILGCAGTALAQPRECAFDATRNGRVVGRLFISDAGGGAPLRATITSGARVACGPAIITVSHGNAQFACHGTTVVVARAGGLYTWTAGTRSGTLVPLGCSPLAVTGFDHAGVRAVYLNESLVFTFSAPVDPASVNANTIRIRFDASALDQNGDCAPDDPNALSVTPAGMFVVLGPRVIFRPRLPESPNNADTAYPPTYADCIGNRHDGIVTVSIPDGSAGPSVRSLAGVPLATAYASDFTTIFDPLFPPAVSPSSFTDTTPGFHPSLLAMVSPAMTTNVPAGTCVRVRFSEPILPSSLSPTSIFMTAIAPHTHLLQRVPSLPFVTQEGATSLVTLWVGEDEACGPNPNAHLSSGVQFVVNVTAGVTGFGFNDEVIVPGTQPSFTTAAMGEQMRCVAEHFDGGPVGSCNAIGEDPTETSAAWGTDLNLPGRLVSTAGGTGADGPFEPTADTTIDTSSRPGTPGDPLNPPGTFNWTRVHVPEGVTVRVVGPYPLRARAASVDVNGVIDASGAPGGDFDPTFPTVAGLGGSGGPGGGSGGNGGIDTTTPGTPGPEDGTSGTSAAPDGVTGAGQGSAGFVGTGPNQQAGGGGGGSYGTIGAPGVADSNVGGASGSLFGGPTLDPRLGLLLGGAGGGGAGFSTRPSGPAPLREAGAGGGGSGGAIEIMSGNITVATLTTDPNTMPAAIKSDGGRGGWVPIATPVLFAAAGGGGSGGAILLRAVRDVQILSILGRPDRTWVTTRGGTGGTVNGATGPGAGGNGGKGRINFQANGIVTEGSGTISIVDPPDVNFVNNQPDPWDMTGQYSFGTSRWVDTRQLFPDYSFDRNVDVNDTSSQFATARYPREAIVQYLFQGAPEDPLHPGQPDETAIVPGPNEFTTNIDALDDLRFVRFRVILLNPPPGFNPTPGQVPTVDDLVIRFLGT